MSDTKTLDEILDRFGSEVIEAYLMASKSRAAADLSLVSCLNEAEQAILDWHNKQTLELLDRLSAVSSYTDKEFRENPQSCLGKRDVRLAIEAERNKLKEPKL